MMTKNCMFEQLHHKAWLCHKLLINKSIHGTDIWQVFYFYIAKLKKVVTFACPAGWFFGWVVHTVAECITCVHATSLMDEQTSIKCPVKNSIKILTTFIKHKVKHDQIIKPLPNWEYRKTRAGLLLFCAYCDLERWGKECCVDRKHLPAKEKSFATMGILCNNGKNQKGDGIKRISHIVRTVWTICFL